VIFYQCQFPSDHNDNDRVVETSKERICCAHSGVNNTVIITCYRVSRPDDDSFVTTTATIESSA